MQETAEIHDIVAARAGDQAAFARLVEPYRHELLVHCYRMLGSFEDAEDTLQETLLRAWRRLASFEGRAPFRAWCYKIATHAALDARDHLQRRSLPTFTHAPADPHAPLPPPLMEPLWLEPLPDAVMTPGCTSPEALYDMRESVALAFLATLQRLPGRQRAVLILRDVLAWRADEVAELLDLTVAAVNSALQRARATMQTLPGTYRMDASTPATNAGVATLLTDYVQAWEETDLLRLTALLHDDAQLTMPPVPAWFFGRTAIHAFLHEHLFGGRPAGAFRLLPIQANCSPAFAAYTLGPDGVYHPAALQVLTISGDRITSMHDFLAVDDRLFTQFNLALTI